MRKKSQIRSSVGPTGMLIYTPDEQQVCIAYDVNGSRYTLRNEPAFLWSGKEEIFRLSYFDNYTEKEAIFLSIRLLVEFLGVSFLPQFLKDYVPIRQIIGLYFFLFAAIYIVEFAILRGRQRRKSERGRALLRWQGALNKAINAFEKKHELPSFEEIQKASKYRGYKDSYMEPHEIVGVLFFFVSISFFMPTVFWQLVSIPVLVLLTISAYRTSFFGILRCTYVAEPEIYESQMAHSLIEFWESVSNSNTIVCAKISGIT